MKTGRKLTHVLSVAGRHWRVSGWQPEQAVMLMLSATGVVVAGFPVRSWASAVLMRDAVVRSVCRADSHCLHWHPCSSVC